MKRFHNGGRMLALLLLAVVLMSSIYEVTVRAGEVRAEREMEAEDGAEDGAGSETKSDAGQEATVSHSDADVLEQYYREVKSAFSLPLYQGEDIKVDAAASVTDESSVITEGYDLKEAAVLLEQGGKVSFRFDLAQSAGYTIRLAYYDASTSTLPISCAISIDGVYPYYEMRKQQFECNWRYETEEFDTDRYGNEIVPESVRTGEWMETYLKDASAVTMEPFTFELEQGPHEITLSSSQGNIVIAAIILSGQPEWKGLETGTPKGNEIRVLEAEHLTRKNSAAIRPAGAYDTSIYPYSYSTLKLNMLSGSSFSDGGQSVTYDFTVEKSGYYYLGFKYRQSAKTDFPVFRYVYVDGVLCTEDFRNVAFDYSKGFTTMTVEDKQGNPIGIYLEAGVTHSLTLLVSLEHMADIIDGINSLMTEINDVSLQIMKISGNSTSKYRDFDIKAFIPDIEERLNDWADRIETLYGMLAVYNPSAKTIGEYSTLKICVKQLRSLADDIDNLPKRIDELYQGDSSVSQYLANAHESLYSSPLTLDQIYIYQDKSSLPKQKGFFYKLAMSVRRFFYSFTVKDYVAEGSDDTETIEIWVNRSRLYIELMQKMADDDFYDRTGIKVNLSLMPNEEKLVLATASGNAPDAALGVTYTIPAELALRGAICDLSQFDDWEEVSARFSPGLVDVGALDGGYYLVPETTDFLVLFYRKDILDGLGLTVPDTMEDVKEMLPVLKRYGMDFYSHIAGHSGTKTLSVLVPFIYQQSGRIYGETADELLVTKDEMVAAFSEMSDLFSIYDVPYEVSNFYQHFRSGTLPIGISGFNTYMTLINSAPEIENSWSLAPYPGYKDENGEILRYISGAQSTAVVFSSSEKQEAAWEFLKWWTSAKVQSDFADTLQLTYGEEYMWNTANLEAFQGLPWNEDHKEAILTMLDWVTEVPRVPGTYMTQRSLSNALNNIVLKGNNVRQELNEAQKDIQAEVNSKLEEFGYSGAGSSGRKFKIIHGEEGRRNE